MQQKHATENIATYSQQHMQNNNNIIFTVPNVSISKCIYKITLRNDPIARFGPTLKIVIRTGLTQTQQPSTKILPSFGQYTYI